MSDPDALAALYARAFPELRPWTAGEIARLIDQPNVTCAAAPHGFALARAVGPEAEVLTIATDPDHRRRGIATGVLGELLARLARAGVTEVHLEVAADNAAAIALYGRAGFTRTGLRRGYYPARDGSRTDALILTRDATRGLEESG